MSMLLQATAGGGGERQWKDWVLEKETELRLEVPEDTLVDVKVNYIPSVTGAGLRHQWCCHIEICSHTPATGGHCRGVWYRDGKEQELQSQSQTKDCYIHLAWLHLAGGGGAPGNLRLRGDTNGDVPQQSHSNRSAAPSP